MILQNTYTFYSHLSSQPPNFHFFVHQISLGSPINVKNINQNVNLHAILCELPQRNVRHLVQCCITNSKYHAINKLTGGGLFQNNITYCKRSILTRSEMGKRFWWSDTFMIQFPYPSLLSRSLILSAVVMGREGIEPTLDFTAEVQKYLPNN